MTIFLWVVVSDSVQSLYLLPGMIEPTDYHVSSESNPPDNQSCSMNRWKAPLP